MRHKQVKLGMGLLALLAGFVGLHLGDARPLVRTVGLDQPPTAMVVDTHTARAFVGTAASGTPGHVAVVDTRSGGLLRTVAVGATPLALAVDERGGRVFVARADASLSLLDARSGRVRRTVALGLVPVAMAIDAQAGHLVVAGVAVGGPLTGAAGAGTVRLLETRDGAVLSTVIVARPGPVAVAVDELTHHAFVVNAGYFERHMAGTVTVLDTRNGALVRTVAVGLDPTAVAVDARRGRVFVANSGSDSVSVLDARSGAVLDTVSLGHSPTAMAVDEANGRVVVLTAADTSVSILVARSGRVWETIALGQGVNAGEASTGALAVDPRRGRAFVVTGHETSVRVVDVRTGTVLRTIAIGGQPVAVAVDERTRRAVVATSAGARPAPAAWWENAAQRLRTGLPWLPPLGEDVPTTPGNVSVLDASQL
jgi:YVTN family beta-propeller protein